MSIASEITRIQTAKAAIKSALEDRGATVGNKTIDEYSDILDNVDGEYWDPNIEHLTFEGAAGSEYVYWMTTTSAWKKTIEYSKDNGTTWTSLTSGTSAVASNAISISVGETVLIRGNNDRYSNGIRFCYFQATSPGFEFYAYGNITDLLKIGYKQKIPYAGFYRLFYNCSCLRLNKTNHPLVLPSPEVGAAGYQEMFRGCSGITNMPDLPATILSTFCYQGMFYNCSNLTTVTATLPATTLAYGCYLNMFAFCTSLTTTPTLPATRILAYSYQYMFQGCTALVNPPTLPATIVNSYGYQYMFYNCTSLTTAPELPATTINTACYQYMFYNCTSLTTGPSTLPATTLYNNCYHTMFRGCSSLTTPPTLPATTLATGCYTTMFYECTSLIVAPELPAETLVSSCYNTMFYGCSKLKYIRAYFTTTPSTTYTNNWVYGVAATGTFIKNASATWSLTGNHGVPTGWTVKGDYSKQYLTFEAVQSGTFKFTNALQYSVDGGSTWTTLAANTNSPTVSAGSTIMWKQTGLTPNSSNGIGKFSSTKAFNVRGNVMSLTHGDNFVNATIVQNYEFYDLFKSSAGLIDASNLVLPATTLAESCYAYMFERCTSLTTPPELPATTLANNCYEGMFTDCTSLTTPPELPATTLIDSCYSVMFYDCTSLTKAPELPATTLAYNCYCGMFQGCTSLNYIKCLATNISAFDCTFYWVYGVAETGTFVKNSSMSSWTIGEDGIPSGWTVQNA